MNNIGRYDIDTQPIDRDDVCHVCKNEVGSQSCKKATGMRVLLVRKVCKMGSQRGRFHVNTLHNVS